MRNLRQQFPKAPAGPPDRDPKQVDLLIQSKLPDRSVKFQAPPPLVPTGRWTPTGALEHFLAVRVETVAFLQFNGSAVVALNHAVAVAMSAATAGRPATSEDARLDFEAGLQRIDALGASGELDRYYLFHAARADILRRMGRREEARTAYERALELAANRVEQEFLKRRLSQITEPQPDRTGRGRAARS